MTATITIAAIVEKFIDETYRNNPKAAQEFRSNCKRWCLTLGSHLQASAEELLGYSYAAKVMAYQEHLALTRPNEPSASKNVRTSIGKLHATYHAMLASADLPLDFTGAFRAAMDAKGLSPNDLNLQLKERYFNAERPSWYGSQLWGFYSGTAGPGKSWKGDSKLLLARCEEILGLAKDSLISRAYPEVNPVLLGPAQEIPYRVARRAQHGLNYALRALPPRISKIFDEYADWRFQRIVQLADGNSMGVDERSVWTSPRTRYMHSMMLRRFLGWLCLPASEKPFADRSDEERWHTGLGLAPKDLRMAQVFDIALILKYLEFARGRQHNHAYTTGHADFVFFVNGWTSCAFSYLPNHPQHAKEFGLREPATQAEWLATVEDLHQRIQIIKRIVLKAIDGKQRSPDEPLRHVMTHHDPFNLFAESIDRAEQSPPLKANRFRWAVWARDVALFRMQMDVPLRARNLVDLVLHRHLRREPSTGKWRLVIPKSDLKNHYSKHAEDIDRRFSEATSKAIDRYVDEARGDLIGGRESNMFFLGTEAGRRANKTFVAAAGYKVSIYAIDRAIRNHLTKYFGAGQGITIFRHLTVTAILKDDPTQVEVAAAELNDAVGTVVANYKHLLQGDKLRLSQKWRDAKRRHRECDPPPPEPTD